MSDEDKISSYNISTISNRQVVRITKTINKGIICWSNNKLSELTSYKMYGRQSRKLPIRSGRGGVSWENMSPWSMKVSINYTSCSEVIFIFRFGDGATTRSFVASVSGLRIISLMVWGRSSWVQVESDQWKIVNMKSTIDGHALLFEWENSWVKHVLFKQEKNVMYNTGYTAELKWCSLLSLPLLAEMRLFLLIT